MKPKDKCVSRELAQELWELGWRIDSGWWWTRCETGKDEAWFLDEQYNGMYNIAHNITQYPASDASEIMELLPEKVEADFAAFRMFPYKINGQYGCAFECYLDSTCNCDKCDKKECRTNEFADTLANALAKMLVYLTKEKLVEVENG